MNYISRTAIIIAALAMFAGCGVEDATDGDEAQWIALFDVCTGDEIGAKDLVSGEYYLADGSQVNEVDIDREFVDEAVDLCLTEQEDVLYAAWANKNCWMLMEGGASCSGCCFCSGNTCLCWESCTDIQY